jgi:hypothetical protein
MITNPALVGQKKQVRQVKEVVEKDLIFTLIRGRDVKKWYVLKEDRRIIVAHNTGSAKPLPERTMKLDYPKSYEYFSQVKQELQNRAVHKLWGKGNPFHSIYDISDYTFYPYKVI